MIRSVIIDQIEKIKCLFDFNKPKFKDKRHMDELHELYGMPHYSTFEVP